MDDKKEKAVVQKNRNSSIELFRIITMFIIVAHHFVMNSGLIDKINAESTKSLNSIFLLLFGWGGKTGINCFVMITGYYMCKSNITIKKFLKLILEIEFYRIIIFLIFLLTGYSNFDIKVLIKAVIPIYGIGTGFTSSYIMFFLFIPFLNILIKNMTEKQHLKLIGLGILMYTVYTTFLMANVVVSYVGWFMVIYFIASFIRLYPNKWFENKKFCGIMMLLSVICSWASILGIVYILHSDQYYYFVADSNKILALVTSIFAFLFFKNIKMRYSKIINTVAASAFGVFLIHANSSDMRSWLWKDVLDNVGHFESKYLIVYAFISVIAIYIICTVIDILRINFLEKPLFKLYDIKFKEKTKS